MPQHWDEGVVLCPDRIERQLIRAYAELALKPPRMDGSRTATLARFGAFEVRITELGPDDASPKVPPLWIEILSHGGFATIDGSGCFELDEAERIAVELVYEARRRDREMNIRKEDRVHPGPCCLRRAGRVGSMPG
jgi:hypothetical protein